MLVTDPKKILGVIEGFYSGLYKKDDLEPSENLMNIFLENPLMPRLSVDDSQVCEGKLTIEECVKSLNSFEPNKCPGNDGLTVGFYKFFWNIVGELLVASLNYSYDVGELSNLQKKAIIYNIIGKKGKDKRHISNWRPISLINVDVKIGSKAIAKRLERVLPSIIHFNQCAYVKGRTIFDAVRTVEDILDYTERFKINGRLIAIDFKKAFDSVSREFFFVPYLLFVLALLLSYGFTLFIIIFLAVFQTMVSLPHILTFSVALGSGILFLLTCLLSC